MTEEEKNDQTEETTAPDEAAGSDDVAEAPAAEAAPEEDAGPAEALSPKERRRRERSAHSGEARPSRTVEERTAERVERRRKKAEERRRWRVKSREKRKPATPREGTPRAEDTGTANGRERQGIVVSDKADKTITVRVDMARQHRTYGKIVRTSSTLHAHDESNAASAGDTVRVVESRPLSRLKRWRLVEILERAR